MYKFLKRIGFFLIIIMLLPYMITIFINGDEVAKKVNLNGSTLYVRVRNEDKEKNISINEYGIGILAKEMDAGYHLEALKAQAVLIRTSLYKSIQEDGSEAIHEKEYWTTAQMKQNWGISNYAEYYEKIKEAWNSTKGQVLMYENKLALTPYHKLSNGKTRSGNEVFDTEDYPYLKIKKCEEDKESKDAMTVCMIQEEKVKIKEKDNAGYVTKIKCEEGTLTGEEFRNKYHLPSASFTIQEYEDQIRITTKGIGHGLGMSQYYANILAKEGSEHIDILEYFFEGTKLEEVAQIVVQ